MKPNKHTDKNGNIVINFREYKKSESNGISEMEPKNFITERTAKIAYKALPLDELAYNSFPNHCCFIVNTFATMAALEFDTGITLQKEDNSFFTDYTFIINLITAHQILQGLTYLWDSNLLKREISNYFDDEFYDYSFNAEIFLKTLISPE